MSGYSFKVSDSQGTRTFPWTGADRIFTTPEFQRRYDEVELSLLTPKVALVPAPFFNPGEARAALADVVRLRDTDSVDFVEIPALGSVLVYSLSIDESLSKAIAQTVYTTGGNAPRVLPEMYYLLTSLALCGEYNKIVASYRDGWLHLVIAQGKSLLLANCFECRDFTTAEYFIFLSLKKLQLNPEISTICLRTPVSTEEEMSLYRYFKSVELL